MENLKPTFADVVTLARNSLIPARQSPANARQAWEAINDARESVFQHSADPEVSDLLSELDTIAAECRELF